MKQQPGSIAATLPRLEAEPWWPVMRGRRRPDADLDQVICLGRFLRWLEREGRQATDCTDADLATYEATLAPCRPGPRAAYARAAQDFVDFVRAQASSSRAS
jgi:hypothetical protein